MNLKSLSIVKDKFPGLTKVIEMANQSNAELISNLRLLLAQDTNLDSVITKQGLPEVNSAEFLIK